MGIAAFLLLSVGLAGCGSSNPGSDKPSEDMKALCSAYTTLPGSGPVVSRVRAWNEGFAEVVPPEGMPELARTGMRLLSEMSTRTTSFPGTRDDVAAIEGFHAYATKNCGSRPFRMIIETS